MKFAWPAMLWTLLALPLLAGAYALYAARRPPPRLRMVAEAINTAATPARHLPAALLLGAIGFLLLSAARPSAVLPLPSHHETVILAIDVSHSMRAEDIFPTRLAAAQEAARAFVARQRPQTRIGIVAFSGEAPLVQAPTTDRDALRDAIDALHTQDATAIGAAIVTSVRALFPEDGLTAAAPGSYTSAAVILMTDGQNTAGPDASEAAAFAAERGVRVYTVGFGTPHGATVGGPGWAVHVFLDERLLREIADTTRAEYLHAETAAELKHAYATLTSRLVLEGRSTEITAFLCALAALAAVLAAGISLASFARVA
ncbi:MAG TPA: VWA domain-containing protein [Burkholderiales bacterium]|nr:VWA domain-containing protein [Burkholderiales bacterium]